MKTKPKDKDEIYESNKKNSDEMFCYSCGSIVKINAYTCPKCGVPLKYIPRNRKTTKEKETAIFLSMFTSFLAWAYLYQKSEIKFWVGLVVSLISLTVAKLLYDSSYYNWYLSLIPFIAIWIFVIIDVSSKNKEYYKSFRGS